MKKVHRQIIVVINQSQNQIISTTCVIDIIGSTSQIRVVNQYNKFFLTIGLVCYNVYSLVYYKHKANNIKYFDIFWEFGLSAYRLIKYYG